MIIFTSTRLHHRQSRLWLMHDANVWNSDCNSSNLNIAYVWVAFR